MQMRSMGQWEKRAQRMRQHISRKVYMYLTDPVSEAGAPLISASCWLCLLPY